jgi:adenylyltransferase/sulfurtransferase
MKHPLIIGAGGVASYLLPCLLKAFKLERVTVIDKDVLEERNLDRQLFSYTDVGKYKASALVERLIKDGTNGAVIDVIVDWFTGVTQLPEGVDAIICVADNHEARRNAIQLAYEHDIRCYIGGNEYFDAEAYVTWRDHEETKRTHGSGILNSQ